MSTNQITGDYGEGEVVSLVPCPNCTSKLMLLPKNYPLFDIQCTACNFRAQVKTKLIKPQDEILGAGWEIMDKVTRSGYPVPSLIVNFKWTDQGLQKQEIRFYPFIPKVNLKKRQLPPTAKRANYWMFNYVGLDKLPYFVLYKNF
ncbi:MAG TPA: DpnI domain-containing protein [Candidatus Saccharimonadales bacterium]|nr:DpnI domain-containing protein [Candidatus Saccharimonadales bacterium]